MKKKILLVDDSALMRRVLCDIIDSDDRFEVVDRAMNGLEAFDLLSRNTYDAVVLDVNMPRMGGIQLLQELRKYKISARILMASTDTIEGAKTTMDALELGALDFVHKPDSAAECKQESFRERLLQTLAVVANSRPPVFDTAQKIVKDQETIQKVVDIAKKHSATSGRKVVAIASSTGGPRALQAVIPRLPANLNAPVVLVQHMPKGFTASLAERLNNMSSVAVKEAAEGDVLRAGWVYLAMGGMHMNVREVNGQCVIHYSDEPPREGVKPCANYMYESLSDCGQFDGVVCVVMTGMGADGTAGIKNLKPKKKIHVIAQNQESCTVYGMPKSAVNAGLADQVVPLDQIAQEIILNVGVK